MSECLTAHPALQNLPQGWFHHGQKILELLEEYKPKVCVELGSWKGASAVAMARVLRKWRGTLTCVDTWAADAFYGGVMKGEPIPPPTMLDECAGNLVKAELSATVRFVCATTTDAAKWWTEPIDFLYVDADHSFASVLADLEAWVPHVKPGGLIAGDDYANPAFPGVRMAWNYFEHEHGLQLQRYPTPHTNPQGMELIYGTVSPKEISHGRREDDPQG
jgi:predicted O-methyltransferase YrrM